MHASHLRLSVCPQHTLHFVHLVTKSWQFNETLIMSVEIVVEDEGILVNGREGQPMHVCGAAPSTIATGFRGHREACLQAGCREEDIHDGLRAVSPTAHAGISLSWAQVPFSPTPRSDLHPEGGMSEHPLGTMQCGWGRYTEGRATKVSHRKHSLHTGCLWRAHLTLVKKAPEF